MNIIKILNKYYFLLLAFIVYIFDTIYFKKKGKWFFSLDDTAPTDTELNKWIRDKSTHYVILKVVFVSFLYFGLSKNIN